MKMVITRVSEASVYVDNKLISKIDNGFLVLVGFNNTDTFDIGVKMIDKLLKLRIFSDNEGKMNLDINKVDGQVLFISQFTLYADSKKGNRPSFVNAMPGVLANNLYDELYNYLNSKITSHKGVFGAEMNVLSTNDGPVTIILDSEDLF